jgi:hypothetical protein
MSSPSTTNQDKRQMKTISLTIPMDFNALNRSAEMLTGLAEDVLWSERGELGELKAPTLSEGQVDEGRIDPSFEGSIPVSQGGHMIDHLTAPETPEGQFVADRLAGSRDDPDFQEPPHEKTPAEVFGEAETAGDEAETARVLEEMESKSISLDQAADEGVELDGDGLPWDHRIHASSKAKLSKAPKGWKRKRGVDPEVIAEVETELRAAMSAGPHNPVKTAPAKPAVPAEPAPAPAVPTDSTVATFPELMAAITAGGIAPAAVLAAVNLQGLTSLPLLASRPLLIPAVARTLGL